MNIQRLYVNNLYSYSELEVEFDKYNLIVGPNNSGKTNILRIIDLIKKNDVPLSIFPLEKRLKLDIEKHTLISLSITLSDKEFKLLAELLFNKNIDVQSFPEEIKSLQIIVDWEHVVNDVLNPQKIFCRFGNGLTFWGVNQSVVFYTNETKEKDKLPTNLPPNIIGDPLTMNQYYGEHKFTADRMFSTDKFIDAFLKGDSLEPFFKVNNKKISIISENEVKYNSQNPQKYESNIYDFMGLQKNSGTFVTLWYFLTRLLSNGIDIVREIRPEHKQLADLLFNLKSEKEQNYDKLKTDFGNIFEGTIFQVRPNQKQKDVKEIWIIENNKEFLLSESASGYYAALFLLYAILNKEDHFILIDEPESHFHPTKVRQIGEMLMALSTLNQNQVSVITHSPLLLDYSLLDSSFSNVVYVRKNLGISSAFFTPDNFKPTLTKHHFDPEVFFEKCSILVEGPSDEYTFKAISNAYDSIFKKNNIALVNVGGKGELESYMQILNVYKIPYVAMADDDYSGDKTNVIMLNKDLEDEIEILGWPRRISLDGKKEKIRPEKAYNFIYDLIVKNNGKSKIESSKFWNIIQLALSYTKN